MTRPRHIKPKRKTYPSWISRFWAMVYRPGLDDCWEWLGKKGQSGHGQFHRNGKMRPAHRVSWELRHGPIPAGNHYGTMCVLHKCDNPPCVNPLHLFLGTQLDNIRDRDMKGRAASAVGTANPGAKLDDEKVRSIRRKYATGKVTLTALAADYSVCKTTVADVVHHRLWTHVR